jgi:hypothetical protein
MALRPLSRKEEILLYLSEGPLEHDIAMPLRSTQPGIRRDLEMSRAACSFCMAELESEHLVKWKMAHIDGFSQRLKAYVITPTAEPEVRRSMQKLEILERAEALAQEFSQLQLVFTLTPRAKG